MRAHHKHLKSTIALERLHQDIKRASGGRHRPQCRELRSLAATHENGLETSGSPKMEHLTEHKKDALQAGA